MALLRTILTDALNEIGVLQAGETPEAFKLQQGLRYAQRMIDAWGADRLTFARQLRTTFVLPSGTAAVTIGASGATVTMARPLSLNWVRYVIPGSLPEQEVTIGQLDEDGFALQQVKTMQSAYPLQSFYQQSMTTALGSLTFWPVVDQDVTIALYTPEAVGVPASINTDLIGPPGYAEAFMYQLALRLLTPNGVSANDVPLLVGPDGFAASSFRNMKRPNVKPAQLSVDPAVTYGLGGGYNVLTDTTRG